MSDATFPPQTGASGARPEAQPATGLTGRERIELTAVVLGVAAIPVYALLRAVYTTFYEPFGMSPEDLGTGYSETLAQTALGIIAIPVLGAIVLTVILMVIGPIVLALQSAGRSLRRRVQTAPKQKPDGTDGSSSGEDRSHEPQPAAAAAAGQVELQEELARGFAEDRERARKRQVAAVAGCCVVGSVILFLQALDDRHAVMSGHGRHPTAAGLLLGSWGADEAMVEPASLDSSPAVTPLMRECLMYLGAHDGTVFLYRTTRHETVRLPESAVVVHIRPNKRTTCR